MSRNSKYEKLFSFSKNEKGVKKGTCKVSGCKADYLLPDGSTTSCRYHLIEEHPQLHEQLIKEWIMKAPELAADTNEVHVGESQSDKIAIAFAQCGMSFSCLDDKAFRDAFRSAIPKGFLFK